AVLAAQAPRRVSLIVHNGTVVTMDGARRVIENGAGAVDGADIVAVDTDDAIRKQFRGAEMLDAGGQVIMPGLVDTHTHAPAVAPHATYTLDGPTLKAARELSKKYGVPMLIHVAETRDEIQTARERFSTSPVAYLESLGVLGPGVLAAHGVWVNDSDIALLKSRGVGVSHNPESNMKLASGPAPVTGYFRAGVALGLGTDRAASNNDLDIVE